MPQVARLNHVTQAFGHDISAALLRAIAPATLVAAGAFSAIVRMLNPAAHKRIEAGPGGSDAMRCSLSRMEEYLDGLPAADPIVRQPFELGLAAMRACRWDEAVTHFRKAMTVTNGAHLVALLNLIGVCRYTQGRTDEALRDFEESARLALELGVKRGGAQALNNIGLVNRDNGDLDTALRFLEESLTIAREFDDRWAVAIELGNIGNVWHDRGDLDRALKFHEQALAIAREIGDLWSVASELANIGSVHQDKGDLNKALKYDEEALAQARKVGYRLGVVKGLANIANIHRTQGKLDSALRYEQEALAIARRAGYSLGVAVDLGNIGLDLMGLKKHEEAVPKLAEALTILLSIGVADGPRQALTGLLRCDDKLGRNRVEILLTGSGLNDGQIADLLDRIDQMRMKRPVPDDSRQLRLATAGQ
jgi:tetratricopeptide (TPR) repeat protein